jgi:NADH:ubiquinone oxidoreductase subunit 3 (subunit A)
MFDALCLARAAATWAIRFYRDHFWLVFGLSLVPTVQRFLVIGSDPPAAVAIGSEVLVALVRILLVVAVVRLMLAGLGTDGRTAWARLRRGIAGRRTAFALQWVILALAFVVFDVIPNVLIALLVPESARTMATATLVAVKNPTVIALTVLWLAGIAHALSTGRSRRADEALPLHYGTKR